MINPSFAAVQSLSLPSSLLVLILILCSVVFARFPVARAPSGQFVVLAFYATCSKHLFLSSLMSCPSRAALHFSCLPSLPPASFCSSCVHTWGTLRTCSAEMLCSLNRFPNAICLPILSQRILFSFLLPFFNAYTFAFLLSLLNFSHYAEYAIEIILARKEKTPYLSWC